jgi:hypothetical protein
MKREISDLSGAIDIIKQIKPKTYRQFQESGLSNKVEYGYLAQDIRDINPSFTFEMKNQNLYNHKVIKPFTYEEIEQGKYKLSINYENHNITNGEILRYKSVKLYENLETEVIDQNNISIIVTVDPQLFENKIEIIGTTVDNLLGVCDTEIFRITTAAVKELINKVEALESIIQQQQQEISLLKTQQ